MWHKAPSFTVNGLLGPFPSSLAKIQDLKRSTVKVTIKVWFWQVKFPCKGGWSSYATKIGIWLSSSIFQSRFPRITSGIVQICNFYGHQDETIIHLLSTPVYLSLNNTKCLTCCVHKSQAGQTWLSGSNASEKNLWALLPCCVAISWSLDLLACANQCGWNGGNIDVPITQNKKKKNFKQFFTRQHIQASSEYLL